MKFISPSENRLCVHFPTLLPGVKEDKITEYLLSKGIQRVSFDIIQLAREQVGKQYSRGTTYHKNESFDCSSFTQWLYGQKGIRIPRISIDQRDFGKEINLSEIKKGDLLFTKGYRNYFFEGEEESGVGHVGIYSGNESVIPAANKKRGVVEDSLEQFLSGGFSGAARFHEELEEAETLLIPEDLGIEYDRHLRWRILQQ